MVVLNWKNILWVQNLYNMKNHTINIEVLNIQNTIFNLLNHNNGVSVHFNFDNESLVLMTFNKIKNEFFLLKEIKIGDVNHHMSSSEKISKEDYIELLVYKKMKEYVETILNCANTDKSSGCVGNSYTVEWRKNGEPTHKSYFYGKDMEDVIEKFYFGKEAYKELFTIYEIKLNPIA